MSKLKFIIQATFNGVAQVTFIENWIYGLIVSIFILLMNVTCGISIILASLFTNLIAVKLYGEESTKTGIHAFNSVILFLLITAFFGGVSNLLLVFPITLVSMLLYHVLTHVLGKFNLTAFALPAVFTTFILFLIQHLFPSCFILESTHTIVHELTKSFASGIIEHFIVNTGTIYLQTNMLFSLVLIGCYAFIQREYLIYVVSSFVFSYGIYFVLSLFMDMDLTSFSTFNVILGMMCAKILGFLKLDKYLLPKLFGMTFVIICADLLLNGILGGFGLDAMTLPFMLVCYGIAVWQNGKKATSKYVVLNEDKVEKEY